MSWRSGVRALQDSFVGNLEHSTRENCFGGEDGHRSHYLSYAKRALYHLSYIPVVKWTKLANLNSKLLFIKEILQLVSLLENRQSLTSWKFIVDVPPWPRGYKIQSSLTQFVPGGFEAFHRRCDTQSKVQRHKKAPKQELRTHAHGQVCIYISWVWMLLWQIVSVSGTYGTGFQISTERSHRPR